MIRKRFALPTLFLIAVILALGGFTMPQAIRAAGDGILSITSLVDNPYSTGSMHFIRGSAGTGNVAYCAQGWLRQPVVGQKLEHYGDLKIPELDYVLWHGYDGEVIDSVYGLDAGRSEAATAHAVWLAIADQRADVLTYVGRDGSSYHGNKAYMERWNLIEDPRIKDAAWRLYQEALAYKQAGGGGVEEGCSCLWLNKTPTYANGIPAFEHQSIVTVEKSRTVRFNKTSACAEVTNGNDSYALEGACYDIHLRDTREKVGSITTDAQGAASLQLKPRTSYFAKETKAPQGFALDPREIPFTTGDDGGSVALEDKPGRARLVLQKKDAATQGGPQNNLSFQGAEYRITSLSTPGWSTDATTDDNGSLTVEDIPLGAFQVVETKAPAGYLLDPNVHTYTALPGQMNDLGIVELQPTDDFMEVPVAFDIEIAKFNDEGAGNGSELETPAEGVSFEIVSRSSQRVMGTITTGADGFASTRGHWFGAGDKTGDLAGALPYDPKGYTVREVASTVPEGFERVDDWDIAPEQLADGVCLRYIVNNTRLMSRVQIIKTDAASGERVALSGFSFQLLNNEKEPVELEAWHPEHGSTSIFTTDATGSVTLPQPLPTGVYYIRETAAQPPYILAETDVRFEIAADQGEIAPLCVVEVADNQARGTASITKTCADGGEALAGAEYDVVALETLVSPDGIVQAGEGETVGRVITDDTGTGSIEDLPLGSGMAHYAFIESVPPQGHALDDTPIPFILSYRNQHAAVVHQHADTQDKPTRVTVDKTVTGTNDPLRGVTYGLWNTRDELPAPTDGPDSSFALRSSSDDLTVAVQPSLTTAEILFDLPSGAAAVIVDDEGAHISAQHGSWITPGNYEVRITNKGDDKHGLVLPLECKAGYSYTVQVRGGLFGLTGSIEQSQALVKPIEAVLSSDWNAYMIERIPSGTYDVLVNSEPVGTCTVAANRPCYLTFEDGSMAAAPILLKPGATLHEATTDEHGVAVFDHIERGSYRLCELDAPAGFLRDERVIDLHVDERGRVDGETDHHLGFKNDYTKMEVSKRDITTEEEVPGAHLSILDSDGNEVCSWVSGDTPHRIDKMPVGIYTLVERLTPRTYDYESSCTFEVLPTGEIQHVALYNKPIEIAGEIDKRQQIADPIAANTVENGDGANKAAVTASPDGRYRYSIDARNTSNTWVDEFTIDDRLTAAEAGLATLESLTTPVAHGDFDGLVNVWYRTKNAGAPTTSDANATRDDGHTNPWLDQPEVVEALGTDGRSLSYDGWTLWAQGVRADAPTELAVDALKLKAGEQIVAIRMEYGRVDDGFTTRSDGWNRSHIKDRHDDCGAIPADDEDDADAPAILTMRLTNAYQEGTHLENEASVHLYRNGGGEQLEDHDSDHVTQTPKHEGPELANTGFPLTPALIVGGLACLCMVTLATRRKR